MKEQARSYTNALHFGCSHRTRACTAVAFPSGSIIGAICKILPVTASQMKSQPLPLLGFFHACAGGLGEWAGRGMRCSEHSIYMDKGSSEISSSILLFK